MTGRLGIPHRSRALRGCRKCDSRRSGINISRLEIFPGIKRFFKANNECMEDLKANEESSCGIIMDANNLCDGVLKNVSLPPKNFQEIDVPLRQILNASAASSNGFVVQVDLDYLDLADDNEKDFPLAPTRTFLTNVSSVTFKLIFRKQWLSKESNHRNKLAQTINTKSDYTVHYLNFEGSFELEWISRKFIDFCISLSPGGKRFTFKKNWKQTTTYKQVGGRIFKPMNKKSSGKKWQANVTEYKCNWIGHSKELEMQKTSLWWKHLAYSVRT